MAGGLWTLALLAALVGKVSKSKARKKSVDTAEKKEDQG
jgi:hypothetical protein